MSVIDLIPFSGTQIVSGFVIVSFVVWITIAESRRAGGHRRS